MGNGGQPPKKIIDIDHFESFAIEISVHGGSALNKLNFSPNLY